MSIDIFEYSKAEWEIILRIKFFIFFLICGFKISKVYVIKITVEPLTFEWLSYQERIPFRNVRINISNKVSTISEIYTIILHSR